MVNFFRKHIISPYKNRTIGYWLSAAAAVIALISAVVYAIVDNGDAMTFSVPALVIMIVGALSFLLVAFFDFKFLSLIPCLLYIAGFCLCLQSTLPSLSDVWNHVNFIGGNGLVALAFTVCFGVSAILSIVTCFMEQYKDHSIEENAKPEESSSAE